MAVLRRALSSVAAVALGAGVFAAPGFASAAGSGGTVTFSAAQAVQGAKLFQQSCAACHGTQLEGGAGPALTGPTFKTLSSKVHANVSDIFNYMTTNMPMNAPASLPHDSYVRIMSFILSKNGYHPGGKPLTFSAASASKANIIH
jgi:mono/diheme cytochrome c family protein